MKFRIILIFVLFIVCCSRGYLYIPPISTTYIPVDIDAERDLILYCKLTAAYFKADEPPAAYRAMKDRIGASTTIIVYTPDLIYSPIEVPSNPDSTRWEIYLDYPRWEARFVTKASWWNPKIKGDTFRRTLEHEQIHFAIAERETRLVTTISIDANKNFHVSGPTQEAVIVRLMEQVEIERKRMLDRVLTWQSKYDLETKNGSDSAAQQEWTQLLLKQIDEMNQDYIEKP